MATVPAGYVFWDVSAKKKYTAGQTMPALGNGDYLVPASTSTTDGYYCIYCYRTSFQSGSGITITDCWDGWIDNPYKTKTSFPPPLKLIGGKPVKKFSFSGCTKMTAAPNMSDHTNLEELNFWNCAALQTAPVMPASIKTLALAFMGCTSLANISNISDLSTYTNVTSAKRMFENCSALTLGVELPATVTDISYMYWKCTNLGGVIRLNGQIAVYTYAFYGTEEEIILLGSGATDSIAATGNNGNVFAGVKAVPKALTAIRCDADGTENSTGEYALISVSFTAPDVLGAKMFPPVLKKDGVVKTVTWKLGSLNGPAVSSSGIALPTSGKLVAIASLESGQTSGEFSVVLNTGYLSETWASSEIRTSLTFKEFIIDVNPGGTGVAIGKESEKDGFEIGLQAEFYEDAVFDKRLHAKGPVDFDGGIVAGGNPSGLAIFAYNTAFTVESGSYAGGNFAITQNGYYPIGIVGHSVSNGSGSGGTFAAFYKLHSTNHAAGSATIAWAARANGGKVNNCTLTVRVLWAKL